MKSTLLLLPNLLGDHRHHEPFLSSGVDKAVASLDGLIAESESAGRRYLGRFKTAKPANEIPIAVYKETSSMDEINFFLEPILKGERWGLVSDAGLPCVADPGARLVRRARQLGVQIQAFSCPSSIMLGLMHSGFSGQRFSFHGYLNKEPQQRRKEIKQLETSARKEKSVQIFIEAPYRNRHLLESLISELSDDMWLCVAWELTMPEQGVLSQQVALWKKSTLPNLEKKNAIFLISAE
jgi:16S rRNA (cytidine1402-2'-O)-methyltransferase